MSGVFISARQLVLPACHVGLLFLLTDIAAGDRAFKVGGVLETAFEERAIFDPEAAAEAARVFRTEDRPQSDPHFPKYDQAAEKAKKRLPSIFVKLDINGDNLVTVEELWTWLTHNSLLTELRTAKQHLQLKDGDGDGLLDEEEYFQELTGPSVSDPDPHSTQQRQLFRLVDRNKDGKLDSRELFELLHPQDTNREDLHVFLLEGDMESMKGSASETLDMDWFLDYVWRGHRLEDWKMDPAPDWSAEAAEYARLSREEGRQRFTQLDKDKDGRLTARELLPALDLMHPSQRWYTHFQARHMLQSADDDKDEKLSLDEMLANPFVFYFASEDDSPIHDEL